MKKYLLVICTLLLLASCADFFEMGDEKITPAASTKSTYVQFKNQGSYNVSVYENFNRLPQQKVCDDIQGFATSKAVEWKGVLGTGFQFYLTYHLPLISTYSIPYEPPIEAAVVEELIKRYETNEVAIPKLNIADDQPLIKDYAYVIIKSSQSFRFMSSGSPLTPEGEKDPLVREGVYKISSGLTSNFKLTVNNITDYTIPSDPPPLGVGTTLQNGYCYSLVFDGTTVSLAKPTAAAQITLANINDKVW